MSPDEIRLRLLEMVRPEGVANPDTAVMIEKAKALEAYVREGQPAPAPQKPAQPQPQPKPGQPQHLGARR